MTARISRHLKQTAAALLVLFSFSIHGCRDSADQDGQLEDILEKPPARETHAVKTVLRQSPLMERVLAPRTDDLNDKTRTLRVLVSYSKTNFFEVKGQIKGFEAELVRQYEKYLQRKMSGRSAKIGIVFIALPFDDLLPALVDGHGDIVAAGLTVTPERQKRVHFSDPYLKDIEELIVAARGVTGLVHKTDLSGRKIHVVSGSSHARHLEKLNQRFIGKGLAPIQIVPMAESLASEDLMEMLNAGIFELTVADSHIAELWTKVFTKTRMREDLVVHTGGNLAWAVRKNNPRLLASVSSFLRNHREGTFVGNLLVKRYYEKSEWIRNPLTGTEKEKLQKTGALFRKYAEMYGFDWLQIAALAYQESRFDQGIKSPRGAVGIMQVKPETAADPHVNVENVSILENNIHAGVKYLAFLRDRYFDDPAIDEDARVDFTLAAYNAGPARINSLRRKAQAIGLNPNKWFFNVEHVARKEIGMETVQYVSSVHKYYIAYKTMNAVWNRKKTTIGRRIDSSPAQCYRGRPGSIQRMISRR
jgi:membrane-bound lytic murein transglycosylase MltF